VGKLSANAKRDRIVLARRGLPFEGLALDALVGAYLLNPGRRAYSLADTAQELLGQPAPELKMPLPFLEGTSAQAPRTPGMDVTGPVPVRPAKETIPFEELMRSLRPSEASEAPAFTPGPATPGLPAAQPAPAAPAQAAPARATAAGL